MFSELQRVSARPYRVKLTEPVQTVKGLLTCRTGYLIHWQARTRSCITEISPLPGYSQESADEALSALSSYLHDQPTAPMPPSADCAAGLASALLSQELRPADKLPSACDLLPAGSDPDALNPGSCLKVKTDHLSPAEAVLFVNQLTKTVPPDCRLRLDAGGAWSADELFRCLSRFPADRIDYIEDPLNRPTDYELWPADTHIGYALDIQTSDWSAENLGPGLKAIVLKPQLVGYGQTINAIRNALKAQIRPVLSSCYESALTLNHYQAIADHFQLDWPHGLGTARLWQRQPSLNADSFLSDDPDCGQVILLRNFND